MHLWEKVCHPKLAVRSDVCLSAPAFSSISSPVNNLPFSSLCYLVCSWSWLPIVFPLQTPPIPEERENNPWFGSASATCWLLVVPWYLIQPSATLAPVRLLVFVVSLLKSKWFNLISSVGVRAASLNTALTAEVWVIVIEFFLIIVSLCAHVTVKILQVAFCAKRCHRLPERAREWILAQTHFLGDCITVFSFFLFKTVSAISASGLLGSLLCERKENIEGLCVTLEEESGIQRNWSPFCHYSNCPRISPGTGVAIE